MLLDSQITGNNTANATAEGEWIHLTGQATCVGLPLGATTHYDLRDDTYERMINHISNTKSCWWSCSRIGKLFTFHS